MKRKGKTLGKRSTNYNRGDAAEIKQEVKEEIRELNNYPTSNIALGNHLNRLPQSQRYRMFKQVEKSLGGGIDYDYLRAILFPELFSSDIPQPFNNLSYCRFSDRSNVTLNTGSAGAATTLWYPRVNQGPCLMYLPSTAASYPSFPSTISATAQGSSQMGFNQDYSTYFTQCNLVAASITFQYIGQLEQESGSWVGSHVYGIDPSALILDDIENGQYVTRCRPSEGLRFVYLPVDGIDYELYPCNATTSGGVGNTHNAGAAPTGNEKTTSLNLTLGAASTCTYFIDGTQNGYMGTISGAVNLIPTPYKTTTGSTLNNAGTANLLNFSTNTNYVAVYWVGMPVTQSWVRVDQMRRFIALPKSSYRDIVEIVRTKKNFDSKKTFDVLRQLAINSPVGGHTLKDLDAHQDQLIDGVMNANEAIELGQLRGFDTLSELSKGLQLNSAESGGISGNFGEAGRIYPYSL